MPALARFVVESITPALTRSEVEARAVKIRFPSSTLPVFHSIKFRNQDYYGNDTLDSIHAHPRRMGRNGNIASPARFDTALVHVRNTDEPSTGLQDLRVGQVRAIFSLTKNDVQQLFPPGVQVPRHLVYIEWFSSFSADADERYQMYRVKKLTGSAKIASVVPLTLVKQSVHLYPKWGYPIWMHIGVSASEIRYDLGSPAPPPAWRLPRTSPEGRNQPSERRAASGSARRLQPPCDLHHAASTTAGSPTSQEHSAYDDGKHVGSLPCTQAQPTNGGWMCLRGAGIEDAAMRRTCASTVSTQGQCLACKRSRR
ncbi:uncharacterized protein B0H18DRAFT_1213673 [Fomitopsis serialis]|uniref:uncharacterized protein n=1 Tax=Fomitopsis serialis TaxID=139415 RepID=UPI0020074710|nr:uncharacterized protein B0H18DRAFT_1213673 [Neoantrodia serialis]KAH9919668.1 hypothetical protein B0H18DRAFT_1213673 [Neoantrodia serialis]